MITILIIIRRIEKKKETQKKKKTHTQEKKNTMENEKETKLRLAEEVKTEIKGLTKSDRRLLKAYLGYIPVRNLHDGKRTMEQACPYVQACLWPDNLDEQEKMTEAQEFDLHHFVNGDENKEPPTIFNSNIKSYEEMFLEAALFTDRQQAGIVRSFQVHYFLLSSLLLFFFLQYVRLDFFR